MAVAWEYLRVRGLPDLAALGSDGWELVAIRDEEWVFKRPQGDPAERFTLDQRDAALADVTAHRGVTRHLLHPEIAALIRRVNHTQMLLIADRGFPVPRVDTIIDLALASDIPTIPQVLDAIAPDLPMDRLLAADELGHASPERLSAYQRSASRVERVPHLRFKELARYAVGCIRTGDSVPYANVLVVGG